MNLDQWLTTIAALNAIVKRMIEAIEVAGEDVTQEQLQEAKDSVEATHLELLAAYAKAKRGRVGRRG